MRHVTRLLFIVAVLLLGNSRPAIAQIATYNLSANFSTNINPNGVWAYGYLTNLSSKFAAFTYRTVTPGDNGNPFFLWSRGAGTLPAIQFVASGTSTSDSGQGVFPAGTVLVFGGFPNSSSDYGSFQFTAPLSGVYTFRIGATNYLNGASAGDADLNIRTNGQVFRSLFFPAVISTNVVFSTYLNQGGTVDFSAGRGTDGNLSGSGFKIGAIVTLDSVGLPAAQLSTDFSPASSSTNGWTLGYKTTTNGAFIQYTAGYSSSGGASSTFANWGRVSSSESVIRKNLGPAPSVVALQGTFPVGGISAIAGPSGNPDNYAVARYTIPASGTYRVTFWGSATGIDSAYAQLGTGSADYLGRFVSSGGSVGYTNDHFYAAGTVIDVAVGRGADNSNYGAILQFDLSVALQASPSLSSSFSTTTNSTNGWTLGWKGTTNGAFTAYTARFTGSGGTGTWEYWGRVNNAESFIRKNVGPGAITIGGQGTTPVGGIQATPGPLAAPDNFAVARYLVPSSGNYRVTVWGDAVGSGDIDVHVANNSVEQFGKFVAAGGNASFTNTYAFLAGDVVDIAVGRGTDNNNSGSYYLFDATVEPVVVVVPPPDIAFTPTSRSFTNQLTVTLINNVGLGSEIRYTINDVAPSIGSLLYTNPVTITGNATIRARLFSSGSPISAVFTNVYTKADDVQFSPAPGFFTNVTAVSMVNLVGSGSEIRYTINGADPTSGSTLYSSALTLTGNATFRAGLFFSGFSVSQIFTAAYTQVLAPGIAFGPTPGLFTNSLTVRLTNTFGSGEVRYTINGAAPTAASTLYSGAFTITSNATIRAGLFLSGAAISSVSVGDYGRVYALNDGVPNDWRLQYFGAGYLTDPRVGAGTDADNDGSSNLQEYLAGTDPLNPLSGFTIGIQAIPRITFVSVPGTTYKIFRRTSANALTGVEVGQVVASGVQTTFIDTSVTDPTGFYTVQSVP